MKKLATFLIAFLLIFLVFFTKKSKIESETKFLTTQQGWSNDLQTIIWNEELGHYDLYFLHSADGPLNPFGKSGQDWVHTTTTDFIHFTQQSTAINAKSNAKQSWTSAWTGSIFVNQGQISELETGQPVAYFSGLDAEGRQMIYGVASNDKGKTFTKLLNNGKPLLTTEQANNKQDFRDPYVFSLGKQLMMYVAEGDEIGIYHSLDGISWESQGLKLGADRFFRGRDWTGNTPIECPIIKTMSSPDGQIKQVLFFGAKDEKNGETTGTYYIIGQIQEDGDFIPETDVRRLDFGSDYYGANFSGNQNIEDSNDFLISMGWIGNWNYFTNGVHSSQDSNSDYLTELGSYSSARKLTLTNDLTIQSQLFINEESLVLEDELSITTDLPARNPQEKWQVPLTEAADFYGLYDLPNLDANSLYQLEFGQQGEPVTDDLAIVIWQKADFVQFIYSPETGKLSVQASAEELKNGNDQTDRAYDYYRQGLNQAANGYDIQLTPQQTDKITLTVVTNNRMVEIYFPNGQTYTVSRFNSSDLQDFKIFTQNDKTTLNLKRYRFK